MWVDIIDRTPTAPASYWDLGFVTLDVTDPSNLLHLDDSTYVDPEPIVGAPYEGNARAAMFGGGSDYIFGGDEDFSPDNFAVSYDGVDYPAGVALLGDDLATWPATSRTSAGRLRFGRGPDGGRTADRPHRPRARVPARPLSRHSNMEGSYSQNVHEAGTEVTEPSPNTSWAPSISVIAPALG